MQENSSAMLLDCADVVRWLALDDAAERSLWSSAGERREAASGD